MFRSSSDGFREELYPSYELLYDASPGLRQLTRGMGCGGRGGVGRVRCIRRAVFRERIRDAQVGAMYEFTCQFATLEPPPPELQQLLGAVHGSQAAMDGLRA